MCPIKKKKKMSVNVTQKLTFIHSDSFTKNKYLKIIVTIIFSFCKVTFIKSGKFCSSGWRIQTSSALEEERGLGEIGYDDQMDNVAHFTSFTVLLAIFTINWKTNRKNAVKLTTFLLLMTQSVFLTDDQAITSCLLI